MEPRRRRPQAALYQPRHGDRRAGARPCRPARHHPPLLHHGRHRRRHRLQPRRILRHRRLRPRRLADHRSADRGMRARLEGVRDGGRPRQGGQLHHHLLDREHRPDGRAHRRFDHRRAGADADRQGIPDHAQRLDRGAARDRRRDRRLQRAVRRQPGRRPPRRHRDEPARLALVRACLQGHRLPDRQDRRQARRRLHAGRAGERHHRRRDAGLLRAVDRLRRHQDPALRLREVPRRRADADHRHEVGRRGHGDRPHLPGIAAEGAARAGNRPHRPRRDRDPRPRPWRRPATPSAPRSARRRPTGCAWSRRRSAWAPRSTKCTTCARSTRGSSSRSQASSPWKRASASTACRRTPRTCAC